MQYILNADSQTGGRIDWDQSPLFWRGRSQRQLIQVNYYYSRAFNCNIGLILQFYRADVDESGYIGTGRQFELLFVIDFMSVNLCNILARSINSLADSKFCISLQNCNPHPRLCHIHRKCARWFSKDHKFFDVLPANAKILISKQF